MAPPPNQPRGVWIWLKAAVIAALVRCLLFTLRLRVRGLERLERGRALGKPILYAFWHGRQLGLFKANPEKKLAVLASLSRDGGLQERVCRRFGLAVVRGSSSRGGLTALLGLTRMIREGHALGIAVDGPRGPAFEAKTGIVLLARQSRSPIIPVSIGYNRRHELGRAWDRFQIPAPFGRATVVFGEPIVVPRETATSDLAGWAARVTEALRGLTAEADGG